MREVYIQKSWPILLDAGADVNEQNIDGQTALQLASEFEFTESVKILLAQEGINVNLWNDDGETPLSLASKEGHTEIVKMLLNAGALVNVEEDENMMDVEEEDELPSNTALMMASEFGRTEIVKILLDAGAHVNTVANDGYDTAITLANRKWRELANRNWYEDSSNKEKYEEIIELLIRKGATIPEGDEYQGLRDKREEIIRGKLAMVNVIATKGRTNRRGMPRYAADFMGGKRKSKKSKRKTKRKTRKTRKNRK